MIQNEELAQKLHVSVRAVPSLRKGFMKKTGSQVMVQNIQRWPIGKLIPYARNTRAQIC